MVPARVRSASRPRGSSDPGRGGPIQRFDSGGGRAIQLEVDIQRFYTGCGGAIQLEVNLKPPALVDRGALRGPRGGASRPCMTVSSLFVHTVFRVFGVVRRFNTLQFYLSTPGHVCSCSKQSSWGTIVPRMSKCFGLDGPCELGYEASLWLADRCGPRSGQGCRQLAHRRGPRSGQMICGLRSRLKSRLCYH